MVITGPAELAQKEELPTERRTLELYSEGLLGAFKIGTFDGAVKTHSYPFQDAYDFAGEMRTANIAKGGFLTLFSSPVSPKLQRLLGRFLSQHWGDRREALGRERILPVLKSQRSYTRI